jgi:hypothetical protein
MKTILAAGLAALALTATTVASADPIRAADDHRPLHRAVVVRAPVVYRAGFARPGFYKATYVRAYHHPYHHRHHGAVRVRAPIHRHVA